MLSNFLKVTSVKRGKVQAGTKVLGFKSKHIQL